MSRLSLKQIPKQTERFSVMKIVEETLSCHFEFSISPLFSSFLSFWAINEIKRGYLHGIGVRLPQFEWKIESILGKVSGSRALKYFSLDFGVSYEFCTVHKSSGAILESLLRI